MTDEPPQGARGRLVVAVAAATMLVSYVDRNTLAVLAPTVTAALHMTETEYGFLGSAFSIAYLVSVPMSGWWIDRQGARRGLAASVLVWTTIAALHAVVPGFFALFALRIALGVAEGPSFPGAAQTIYRVMAPAARPRGYALLFTGSSVGSLVAPLLASWLYAETESWKIAFLATAIVGLCWLPLWLIATRPHEIRARLDVDAGDAPAMATETARVSTVELVSHPLMIRALLAVLAAAPVNGFAPVWGAKYLAKAFDVHQGDQGHYLWLPPVGLCIGALGFGDLASRLPRAPGAPPRALWVVAAVLATTLAWLPETVGPWQASAVMACASLGGGGLYTLVTADLLARTPADSVSLAGGIMAGAQSLALIIAGPAIGWSADSTGGYEVAALACGAWVVPGTLVWLLWPPAARLDSEPR